jgi:TPR repeat protein
MRLIVLICSLALAAIAQTSSPNDPQALYIQAMNKLSGSGPNRSDITGVDLMTRAADLGYLPAQLAAGYIYESGRASATANPSRSADYYRKAASQGSHLAEYLLGRLYFVGSYGASRRDGEKWLQSAADSGNPFASYLLGVSIYERDPAGALRRFRVAAEQGLPYAQYRLGNALIEGRVPPVNKRVAYLWLFIAAESGVAEAATQASVLESDLGTTETERAKPEAREMQAKFRRPVVAAGCTGWNGELDAIPTAPPLNLQQFCD